VRVRRVVMIRGHPRQRQPHIPFHLPHEVRNKDRAVKLGL